MPFWNRLRSPYGVGRQVPLVEHVVRRRECSTRVRSVSLVKPPGRLAVEVLEAKIAKQKRRAAKAVSQVYLDTLYGVVLVGGA